MMLIDPRECRECEREFVRRTPLPGRFAGVCSDCISLSVRGETA